MGKRSAMTEKQNKLNKLAMAESVYRKNIDSMLEVYYGEQIRTYARYVNDAYRHTSDTANDERYHERTHIADACMRAIEHQLLPSRYFVNVFECDRIAQHSYTYGCKIHFNNDGFRMIVKPKNNSYICELSHTNSNKKYITYKKDSFAIVKFCEQITRMWDYEMFEEIAE